MWLMIIDCSQAGDTTGRGVRKEQLSRLQNVYRLVNGQLLMRATGLLWHRILDLARTSVKPFGTSAGFVDKRSSGYTPSQSQLGRLWLRRCLIGHQLVLQRFACF
jgi:hypothetical protein